MWSRPLAIGITILICVVWAANFAVSVFYPDRSDPSINAIFAIAAGVTYGLTPKRDSLRGARRSLARLIEGDAPADGEEEPRGDTE